MQHVLTLRKIFLIFGFALVVFGCDANKEIPVTLYSYSTNGELTFRTAFGNDSGKLVKENRYSANGELSGYYEYEYDSNGNMTKGRVYTANGELLSYYEYEYDSNGNRTKESGYYASGELSCYWEFEYDSNGNMTKWSEYNANGELDSYAVYLYKKICEEA